MPIGGVILNTRPTWLIEEMFDYGFDLDFAVHECNCPNEDHDTCWESNGNETYLIGFMECKPDDDNAWFAEVGEVCSFGYKPDPESEFSAISGEIYTQVVRSKWVMDCAMCSPCFPGQGDLENLGQHETYALPPNMFDEGDDCPVDKIRRLKDEIKD